jgi:hypothetical protein
MQKNIGWLSVVGFFGLLAAANAQSPPPAVIGSSYDGTYRLVSSANVNATYTSRKGQTASCPGRRAGPLHIVNGRARYTTATGYRVKGTVGPQGELAMRAEGPGSWGTQPHGTCPPAQPFVQLRFRLAKSVPVKSDSEYRAAVSVIPAKATRKRESRSARPQPLALDPRFRGGDEGQEEARASTCRSTLDGCGSQDFSAFLLPRTRRRHHLRPPTRNLTAHTRWSLRRK